MSRNRLTTIVIGTLALFVTLLIVSCQADQAKPSDSAEEEDEMKEIESQDGIMSVPIDEITNLTWLWSELRENEPATQSAVPDPESYALIFWDDGTFSFQADCNSGSGSYKAQENKIEFGPMTTTLAICPPESLHDQYEALLGEIDTFGLAEDKLVLILKNNAGEMHFSNGGTAEKSEARTEAPEEKTLYIGPEKVDCVGIAPMECYQVKEDPNGEWQMFYDQIEGFEWNPGYTFELRVAVYPVDNPPADASSLRYELIEVMNKIETPVETPQSEAYIRIDKPVAYAEVNAKKPILVSGMGAGLFEGNVVVQILDSQGNELALQPTILQSPEAGMGGEGPWEIEIPISIETATEGKIVAFSPSPKDGEGWIASDEVPIKLLLEMAHDTSLENTTWILRSFANQEDISSLLMVYPVTASLNLEDNTLNGLAGCNNYFTSYTLDGDQLNISAPIGTTRMMCPEPQMILENAYLAALEKSTSYEMTCNAMEINDADGNTLLVFQVDPYSLSKSFSRKELVNISYMNEFAQAKIVQLVDGVYREPVAEGSATELVVFLTTQAVFGDVTGGEAEDAVVVLVSQPGGSGSFYDLAVVHKQDGALANIARIQLGDRVEIKSLHIEDGEIVVEMLTQGQNDPMCCPTQYVSNRYVLENGEIILIRSEEIE